MTDTAKGVVACLAGASIPAYEADRSIIELQERPAKTIAFIGSFTRID